MKSNTKTIFVFLVILLGVGITSEVSAQCAMCKAAVGSSEFSARGLNSGILYLMIIPYIAFSFLAYFWYKSSKKQKEQDKKIVDALKGKVN
ncbi:MAG TPA: hypothetical protein VNW06_05610 [Cytophagaceae bacterium]|jgi:hypothetical protein|nr:hypothetical protein [Cytophagaceae bacterium]